MLPSSDLPPLDAKKPVPRIGDELLKLIGLMRKVAWINLYFGILNLIFFFTGFAHREPVLVTGLVSLFVYWLVKMKINYITGSKSWIEVSVTMACGLYLPVFTLILAVCTLAGFLG